jgi:fermentation-respiration switch protein FrsA (DUF1100 family)
MKRPVSFYSEGVKLVGDVYVPDDLPSGERRAGVVLCHGYTGVKDIYLPDNARVLNEAGYVAMTFDYKGWVTARVRARASRPGAAWPMCRPPSRTYEVYAEPAFGLVMQATWYRQYLPPR